MKLVTTSDGVEVLGRNAAVKLLLAKSESEVACDLIRFDFNFFLRAAGLEPIDPEPKETGDDQPRSG
jgi:hypothetical protein